MVQTFDIDEVRSHFPALSASQTYLDNAGGSQVLREVIDSISKYLSSSNVQMGSTYAIGQESTKRYTDGYRAAASFINADVDEIVIGGSTTQLLRNLSEALEFKSGDELIVSKVDHEANISSWISIADRLKLTLKWWAPPNSTNPKLEAEQLDALLTPKTRLVSCTHSSNVLGTIHDIKAIAEKVHTVQGARLCVDGVAFLPHRRIDVRDLGVDFYCFSWYKVYGPHIGMLYASREAQKDLLSLGHFFDPTDTLEYKLGLAASNYELTQSIPHIVEYLGGDSWQTLYDGIAEHERKLQSVLLDYLSSKEGVTIYGETMPDPSIRFPTISFIVKGRSSKEIVESVEAISGFGFRWGHFYSKRLVEQMLDAGPEGVVRVSAVHYNTVDEMAALVKVLDQVLGVY
ncbi:PLP-dependent transferase [Eremomyces bilateralis CBS 781.70]|uniref:PLP-dependent transferase n=1 Tax=Eremomyces bilateralis CBS 781.70 TaxID=1392243 RepID=A0A6G1GCB4_9PEZI|nr:PLP-dependent transferase [Eremomyces bilateralis CBS 781.70]KAF1815540.1 PLP-dependent transferase [Eremomyces bilateralis CBS 781.70]